ncbi:hypothetical protein [Sphingomonas sp.]|uniref:hypothetical protein n=1 Tax=Sphingomonas sp. TaxID=28214 RepID=UPI003B00B378
MAELKVRFQHTCGDDPEGFKARVGLLAEDLADAPPLILRRAVVEWVRTSPFLPTAADLIRLMREALEARDGGPRTAAPAGFNWMEHVAAKRNAEMAADPHARQGVAWVVLDGSLQLRPCAPPPPRPDDRLARTDVRDANRLMRKLGLLTRYHLDGSAFQLAKGEPDPAGAAEPGDAPMPPDMKARHYGTPRKPTESDYREMMGRDAYDAWQARPAVEEP